MTARILVVDDVSANVKFLEARLTAEYFEVRTASNGADALRICASGGCDILLLDVMMPGMDGLEVCQRLKERPETSHIPVILVTALDQPADRIKGLEAGADDFLTKPVDEIALIARVRSLARLKVTVDELRQRASSSASFGLLQPLPTVWSDDGKNGRILVIEDRRSSAERLVSALADHVVDHETEPQKALFKAAEGAYDLVIVSLGLDNYDGLRLCGQLRSIERTRQVPILVLTEIEDRPRMLRALDIGVNDCLARPVERNELSARVRVQIRRKRYADRLEEVLRESIQLAVVDSLTGLKNRRYFESHLPAMIAAVAEQSQALSLMILDIDHFKAVNDTFGHDAGDDVLKVFASRIKAVVRTGDLFCRLGGEEFVIVMPQTSLAVAAKIAERIRASVNDASFPIENGKREIPITVSIGIADRQRDREPELILKRADKALYRSKADGRNRVSADAA